MNNYILFTICGMFIVTFVPRILPTLVFSKYRMPNMLKRMIKYVPISVFSYLIVSNVLFINGTLDVSFNNLKLIPAVATAVVAYKFRSIGLTILVGVLAFLAYQYGMTMPPL